MCSYLRGIPLPPVLGRFRLLVHRNADQVDHLTETETEGSLFGWIYAWAVAYVGFLLLDIFLCKGNIYSRIIRKSLNETMFKKRITLKLKQEFKSSQRKTISTCNNLNSSRKLQREPGSRLHFLTNNNVTYRLFTLLKCSKRGKHFREKCVAT